MTTQDEVFEVLDDPYGDDGGIARPERTEDKVPRDKNDWPRVLPPDEMDYDDKRLRSYARASSYGKILESTWNLERWSERNVAQGFVQSKTLRLEWAGTGEEDKAQRNDLVKAAKKEARADERARVGTAVHAITERHDLGLSLNNIPEEHVGDLEAWVGFIKHFTLVGIEVFIVEDIYRIAGTFDRLGWYYVPCAVKDADGVPCGRYLRVIDLKTGDSMDWGQITMACQLAGYAHGKRYDPRDGSRSSLGDVCPHRGIIAHLAAGSGKLEAKWINIAQAWNVAIPLVAATKEIRRKRNWLADFSPIIDLFPRIIEATSREELVVLYQTYRAIWTGEHTNAVNVRLNEIGEK